MRTTTSQRSEDRIQRAALTLQCAHCGARVEEALLPCGDCLFLYCRKHGAPGQHLCGAVCAECEPPEGPRH